MRRTAYEKGEKTLFDQLCELTKEVVSQLTWIKNIHLKPALPASPLAIRSAPASSTVDHSPHLNSSRRDKACDSRGEEVHAEEHGETDAQIVAGVPVAQVLRMSLGPLVERTPAGNSPRWHRG